MPKIFLLIALQLLCKLSLATAFMWHKADLGKQIQQQAAILLEVKVNGIACLMQLDTGLGASRLYPHALPASLKVDSRKKWLRIENFSVDGINLHGEEFELFHGFKPSDHEQVCDVTHKTVIGSLGNHYFLNGHLSLDFPNQTISYSESNYLPKSNRYIKARLELYTESGHTIPIIQIDTNFRQAIPLLLDTGSAPAGIIWERSQRWLEASHLVPKQDVRRFKTYRWGKQIQCKSLQKTEPIKIAGKIIGKQIEHSFCSDAGDIIAAKQIDGTLGLALFCDKVLTIDYKAGLIYIED